MAKMSAQGAQEKDWNKALAGIIHHLRMPSFPRVLVEGLLFQANFDTFLLATYKQAFKPIVIYSSYDSDDEKTFASFVNQAYLLDPLYNAIQQGMPSGVYRLKDLAPDSFALTEQYKSCYSDFDLNDEIIYLIRLEGDVVFTVSLGRTSKLGIISRLEMNRLKVIQPVVQALCQQYWQAQSSEFVHDQQTKNTLEYAINTFGRSILTPREQEITGLVLQGYSSKAVADQLGISVGTIKVHRKSIYFKLDISTQSELFSLFIAHLSHS